MTLERFVCWHGNWGAQAVPSAQPMPLKRTFCTAVQAAAGGVKHVIHLPPLLLVLRVPAVKNNAVPAPQRLLQPQHHPAPCDLQGPREATGAVQQQSERERGDAHQHGHASRQHPAEGSGAAGPHPLHSAQEVAAVARVAPPHEALVAAALQEARRQPAMLPILPPGKHLQRQSTRAAGMLVF